MSGGPALPVWLGLAGLTPFWGLSLSLATRVGFGLPRDFIAAALACYAATILSFLGGIRWGMAVSAEDRRPARVDYVISVLPQLAGWVALVLADPWRLAILGLLLLCLGPLDRSLVRRGYAPPWFGALRIALSVGAGAALFLAALA